MRAPKYNDPEFMQYVKSQFPDKEAFSIIISAFQNPPALCNETKFLTFPIQPGVVTFVKILFFDLKTPMSNETYSCTTCCQAMVLVTNECMEFKHTRKSECLGLSWQNGSRLLTIATSLLHAHLSPRKTAVFRLQRYPRDMNGVECQRSDVQSAVLDPMNGQVTVSYIQEEKRDVFKVDNRVHQSVCSNDVRVVHISEFILDKNKRLELSCLTKIYQKETDF